jgi:hypothetical protein
MLLHINVTNVGVVFNGNEILPSTKGFIQEKNYLFAQFAAKNSLHARLCYTM